MGDLPLSLPAFLGRRRLHGFNVAPTTSKFLFPAVSRVVNVIASRRSASAVPARDARTSTRASRRGVVVDGIGALEPAASRRAGARLPATQHLEQAGLVARPRRWRCATPISIRRVFDSGLSRLRGKTGSRGFHGTRRTAPANSSRRAYGRRRIAIGRCARRRYRVA